jgi:hypothetical protein
MPAARAVWQGSRPRTSRSDSTSVTAAVSSTAAASPSCTAKARSARSRTLGKCWAATCGGPPRVSVTPAACYPAPVLVQPRRALPIPVACPRRPTARPQPQVSHHYVPQNQACRPLQVIPARLYRWQGLPAPAARRLPVKASASQLMQLPPAIRRAYVSLA